MSGFQTAVLFYVPLQLASLILLPKWWKLAAVLPVRSAGIFFHGGYMGDVFAAMSMIYGCGYLVFLLFVVGIVKLIRLSLKRRRSEGSGRQD